MRFNRFSGQVGAALAVSLVMLVILTLLGIAAMRSSRLSLRLSENAESRISAMQNAQTTADAVTSPAGNLKVDSGLPFVNCFVNGNSAYAPTTVPTAAAFPGRWQACLTTTLTLPGSANTDFLQQFRYAQVIRESPEFVTANALRGVAGSGRSFDYARFTVIAGFDNSGNGMGAAEVAEGIMKEHVKPTGVNYQ